MAEPRTERPIRYAVVGAGWIAQAAVLPAFARARGSKLETVVSSDATKREELAKRYGLARTYSLDDYDACMKSGEIDAVYIALPNSMHREYTERAARAGIHVLCEKPMAVTEEDCQAMIHAAREGGVRLMVAYRLHFEPANLAAVDAIASGEIGEPRFFESSISQRTEGGIRLDPSLGGGALFDAGVYCVNAARYVLREEPSLVFGMESTVDPPFQGVDETTSALLRFPSGAIAQFTCSLGTARSSAFRVVGTRGELIVDPAFGFDTERHSILIGEGTLSERNYPPGDQFGPQIAYFSDCIRDGKEPEPSGEEGLADVRVLAAIKRSVASGAPVKLEDGFRRATRPDGRQVARGGPIETPSLVHAAPGVT
jgi:glucose-fructose oxidoreductase